MTRKVLLASLTLLAVSGLMLHYRVHPFMIPDTMNPGSVIFDKTKFLATLFPVIDVVVVTMLFMVRRTVVYGYLFNGLIVIFGTVLMIHYSIAEMLAKSIPLHQMILKSTLPDIGIAWVDFLVGKALYDISLRG